MIFGNGGITNGLGLENRFVAVDVSECPKEGQNQSKVKFGSVFCVAEHEPFQNPNEIKILKKATAEIFSLPAGVTEWRVPNCLASFLIHVNYMYRILYMC